MNKFLAVVQLVSLAAILCTNTAAKTDGSSIVITFGHPKVSQFEIAMSQLMRARPQ